MSYDQENSLNDYRVLIVEDEALIAHDISETLRNFGFSVVGSVSTAEESIQAARDLKPDIVIMDIVLKGEMDGIAAAEKIRSEHDIPIIFLTTFTEDHFVERAASQIPYGYLLKPFRSKELGILIELTRQRHQHIQLLQRNNRMLANKLMKSKKRERLLEDISLVDDLTGAYNRRGFRQLARQQIDIARRSNRSMRICFFDCDYLKEINDSFGHREGDNALRAATGILKKTFRCSDIISRWGGDEFVVLMINAECDDILFIEERIARHINEYNDAAEHRYVVSMSCGIEKCEPNDTADIDELVTRADEKMCNNRMCNRI
ncbi:MAG: hypothetical protein A2176_07955 [Spirochaetes bacterium RBG_13_51_14]|nr:MAG: hypothetical protein A2176_07955 [Spirochaetes bacterium RBG_13_51_14]